MESKKETSCFLFIYIFKRHTYNSFEFLQVCACLTPHAQGYSDLEMEKYQPCAVWQSPWHLEAECTLTIYFLWFYRCFSSRSFVIFKYVRIPLHFEHIVWEERMLHYRDVEVQRRQGWGRGSADGELTQNFLYAKNGFSARIFCCCWYL